MLIYYKIDKRKTNIENTINYAVDSKIVQFGFAVKCTSNVWEKFILNSIKADDSFDK